MKTNSANETQIHDAMMSAKKKMLQLHQILEMAKKELEL